MICPHCSTSVKFDWERSRFLEESQTKNIAKQLLFDECNNCKKVVILFREVTLDREDVLGTRYTKKVISENLLYPKGSDFQDANEIPKLYIEDYEEAVKVLSASPKASAALSRRLLQTILRENFDIKHNTLAQEIQSFINKEGIPSHLTDAVDAVRNIGNFAAHPTKNKNTGEIVSVENGEAEWLIEVIEALFDFAFVQPVKLEKRRNKLDLKLSELGKPPLKKKKD